MRMLAAVLAVGLLGALGLLWPAHSVIVPPSSSLSSLSSSSSVLTSWGFAFTLLPSLNETQTSGAEYFDLAEKTVRRDWVVAGPEPPEGCPIKAFGAGSEFVSWRASDYWGDGVARRNILSLAGGLWNCTEDTAPFGVPVPLKGVRLSSDEMVGTRVIRNRTAIGYRHVPSARPGPACGAVYSPWTAWLAEDDTVLLEIDTPCWTLNVFAWGLQVPAMAPGSQSGPLVAPDVCPVQLPPTPLGYSLAAIFIAMLFTAVLTIKRDTTGAAFA